MRVIEGDRWLRTTECTSVPRMYLNVNMSIAAIVFPWRGNSSNLRIALNLPHAGAIAQVANPHTVPRVKVDTHSIKLIRNNLAIRRCQHWLIGRCTRITSATR